MKKLIVTAALIGAALIVAPLATAGNAKNEAKKLTAQQCKAEKKADKAAFKSVYGKRAMRTCKRAGIAETRSEMSNAAQECRTERADDPSDFRDTYGNNREGRNAMGKCVSSKVKADNGEDVETFRNAAKECKAERAEDGEAFRETYGSEKSRGRNALGKCVSSKVKNASTDDGSEEEGAESGS